MTTTLRSVRLGRTQRAGGSLAVLLLVLGATALLRTVTFVGFGSSGAIRSRSLQLRQEGARRVALAARGGDDEEAESDEDYTGVQPTLASMRVGDAYNGVVTRIADYGAFVDVGAEREGLVSIGKLADKRVEKVEDVVKVGDNVKVWVVALTPDPRGTKVSLTMSQNKIFDRRSATADLNDFQDLVDQDEWMQGKVVGMQGFGAFVVVKSPKSGELAQGLVPISKLAATRTEDVSDVVKFGQEVQVRVISCDPAGGKLTLSMVEEGESPLDAFVGMSDETWIEGKVKALTNFGAFVEVTSPTGGAPVQGLLHISEIKDERVEDPAEELEEEQAVKVRVLNVDKAANRMSLSMRMKAAMGTDEAWEAAEAAEAA